jgi:peptidoglycan hydrolase CwlO-like protein
MKVIYILIAFLVFFGYSLFAQPAYTPNVIEITETISVGKKSGYAVNITQAKKKNVENAWQKMLKDYNESKEKVEDQKGEIFITGAFIERLHHDPVNIYALITELDEGARVEAFFELDSVFVNSSNNKDASLVITNIMEEFAIDAFKSAVEDELEEEQKKLSNLEKDLEKLVKENEKMHKTIAMGESDITSLEVELDANKQAYNPNYGKTVPVLDSEGNEIDRAPAPKAVVNIDPDTKKELDKEHKKLSKKKYKLESKIREAERDIPMNLQDQEAKKAEIEEQKKHVEKVMQKLESVENIND